MVGVGTDSEAWRKVRSAKYVRWGTKGAGHCRTHSVTRRSCPIPQDQELRVGIAMVYRRIARSH